MQFRSLTTRSFLALHLETSPSDSCDNSEFCPYSTVVNLVMMAILSFKIPENQYALWLGLCLIQNMYCGAYTLKAGSNSFILDKGRFAIQSLKGSLAVSVIALVKAIWGLSRQWDGIWTNHYQPKHSVKSWGLHKLKPWLKVIR